ncbi:protein kinase STUNTED isoform X1 [Musa acuminata AAA Group]|uniref:protein kinase STUNTED isoform X1 n=2 Tax=Musa acuminata AAA Group TaxID=214697 RepID=UPI0031E21DCA
MQERGGRELQEKKKENEDEGGGKTVLVGIKMDADSRELLTWSLVKIADAGDRVFALHVLPSTPSDSSDASLGCSSLLSIVKAFEAMLAVYEGFCNLKQVDLKMKIARGSSIRKVLVSEAIAYGASSLVVGVAKNSHGIGYSSTSIAKYCARNLPRACSVFAVSNGKTLFKREALPASQPSAQNRAKNAAAVVSAGQQALTRSYTKLLNRRPVKSAVAKGQRPGTTANTSSSSPRCLSNLKRSKSDCDNHIRKDRGSLQRNQSVALVPAKKPEAPASRICLLSADSSEARPGWPLLRKAMLSNRRTASADGSSVVQWAMRLPSRFSATSAVHPDHRPVNSDARAYHRRDAESGAVVPAEDTSSPLLHKEEHKIPKELEHLREKYSSICRLFSYKELGRMTSDFSPEQLIGKGGSSRVYKGCLPDGKELAVKILKHSEDVMNEFISEIEIITALHHKNIISLFGFCFENKDLVLVYDFLSRGSLEDNLHGESSNKHTLSWAERFKVAAGTAEALDYLHGGAGNMQPVIHRDVKSSNILLSEDFEPQLADFGLAKWASASASQLICNDVAGTFGYLAPEYFMYGKVNEKIDVYAFGVVLLELISGRKPVTTGCSKGPESLVMWATRILQAGEVKELVDPCLGTCYDKAELERMMLAASLCIKRAPRSRPQIALVSKLLQGDNDDVLRWARSQVSTSEELEGLDDEAAVFQSNSNIQSHINLALQDIDDDSMSISSTERPNMSWEEYLQGRWSRSSSFD